MKDDSEGEWERMPKAYVFTRHGHPRTGGTWTGPGAGTGSEASAAAVPEAAV
ncbi:hypothetical protein ACFV5G_07930 [Streptomyces sp. NPDC059766]|uniref:hypothetical protein n=1 Tax=Streptomyces sp. NPDC059766 TaxID=3346940 RepID=UPI00364C38D2